MDLELVRDCLSWIFLSVGSLVIVVSSLGVLRLPDYFSRIHAASVTDTLGAGLLLFGLLFQAGLTLAAAKLLMILGFLVLTGPAATHALARTARAQGLGIPAEGRSAGPRSDGEEGERS